LGDGFKHRSPSQQCGNASILSHTLNLSGMRTGSMACHLFEPSGWDKGEIQIAYPNHPNVR